MKAELHFWNYVAAALTALALASSLPAQSWDAIPAASSRENAALQRSETDLPKGPAPRTAQGRPDLSGYWIPSDASKDRPVGNLGKDLPGYKLPLTAAGIAAHRYNVEHTVDPSALCIVAGLPRQDTNGLPFQIVHGSDHLAFLYWTTTYRLVPFAAPGQAASEQAALKHSHDPDPSFFGEEIGSWERDTFVVDSTAFKEKKTWADENANPHSDQLHVVERWTRPDIGHLHLEMVVTDAKYYSRPIRYQRTWLLGRPTDEVPEYSCSEDNVDVSHLRPGPGRIGPDGQRGYQKLAPLPPPPSKQHPAVTSIPN